jgi:N-acetylneuraminic acid mutarotase
MDKGSEYPWRSAKPLPAGRFAMEAVEIAEVIYIVGGENETQQPMSPISYHIQEQTWQTLVDSSNEKWTNLGLASVGPKIYAIGGERNGQLSENTLAYQVLYITVLPIVP